MNFNKQLKDGLIYQNPVLVQVLGMCSTMAITTSVANGFGMGISVLIILTLSNIFISLLRKIIPNEVRIACYIVVIAGFVTIVDLCLQAFVPDIAESLGVFIPLIVVNCIILGRAEAFASKNSVAASAVDGICPGHRLHGGAADPERVPRALGRGHAARHSGHAFFLCSRQYAHAARRRLPLPRHADRHHAVGACQKREEERGKERNGG